MNLDKYAINDKVFWVMNSFQIINVTNISTGVLFAIKVIDFKSGTLNVWKEVIKHPAKIMCNERGNILTTFTQNVSFV